MAHRLPDPSSCPVPQGEGAGQWVDKKYTLPNRSCYDGEMRAGLSNQIRELFLLLPVPCAARQKLVELMSSPERHYHNLDHVELLWTRHRRFAERTEYGSAGLETLIASAIAYHDAIYDPYQANNEDASARLWLQDAQTIEGFSESDIHWVGETIRATSWHFGPLPSETPRDRARIWMLDLDLTPLGEPPEQFERNTKRLRDEVAGLPAEEWDRQRLAFLANAASHPRIYRMQILADAFEAQARANIARELTAAGRPLTPRAPPAPAGRRLRAPRRDPS